MIKDENQTLWRAASVYWYFNVPESMFCSRRFLAKCASIPDELTLYAEASVLVLAPCGRGDGRGPMGEGGPTNNMCTVAILVGCDQRGHN